MYTPRPGGGGVHQAVGYSLWACNLSSKDLEGCERDRQHFGWPSYKSAQFVVVCFAGHGAVTGRGGPAGRRHAPLVARPDPDLRSHRRATRRGHDNPADGAGAGSRVTDRRVGAAKGTSERRECLSERGLKNQLQSVPQREQLACVTKIGRLTVLRQTAYTGCPVTVAT